MAYIGRDTDKISNIEKLDTITFDGSSSYTLQKNSVNFTPNSANSLQVSIDGVVQAGNFTVSGSTIDFGVAIPATSTCDFIFHYGTGLITTPADGTVTTAKIQDGAVTSAKLASGVGGKVLQVVSATKTDTATNTSTTFSNIADLSVSITPSSTSNKILLIMSVSAGNSAGSAQYRFARGGTGIAVGDASSNRTQTTFSAGSETGNRMYGFGSNFLDSPNTTSATTYSIQWRVQNAGTTIYINRSPDDTDTESFPRGSSTITAMEISG